MIGKLISNYRPGSLYSHEKQYACDVCLTIFKDIVWGENISESSDCPLCVATDAKPTDKMTVAQIEQRKKELRNKVKYTVKENDPVPNITYTYETPWDIPNEGTFRTVWNDYVDYGYRGSWFLKLQDDGSWKNLDDEESLRVLKVWMKLQKEEDGKK